MEETRASDSAATDKTAPSRIADSRSSDDRRDVDDDDAAVGGEGVRADELMNDVVSKVSDAVDDGVLDVDLVGDGKDCVRGLRGGEVEVADLPSRVSGEEGEAKQSDGQVSFVQEEEDDDDPVELSISLSGSDVRDEDSEEEEDKDPSVSRYDSLLSKFDNYAGAASGSSRASTFGFRVGDLVWGKVKSHPWWPGHIFNEAFASSSVRRMRREGHILVAFFGDSSYGWFNPAELVPFDEHFVEKSKQTSAKSFVKAVEEAVDEVCRRRALGVSCRCRNLQNFRPANEEGYFAVDLGDYVAVYPQPLIDRSRARFQPLETIRFVSQLARRPLNCDHKSLDLSENKAVVMQLRKAMFEEFDDTYSEAFGYPPERPIRAPKNLGDDSLRVQAQAQLSGPLVIAETLRGKKNSTKSMKVKDKSKKNKYLLKRRDESDGSKESQFRDMQLKSSADLSYVEGELELASSDFVLQRRSPATSTKTNLLPIEDTESLDQKASFKNENDTLSEMKDPDSLCEAAKTNSSLQPKAEEATAVKHHESAQVIDYVEDVHRTQMNSITVGKSHSMQPIDSAFHPETKAVGSNKKMVMKKPKTPKRPIGEMGSGMAISEEKKAKKKKIKREAVEGQPDKRVHIGKADPVSSLKDGNVKDRVSTVLHGAVVNLPLNASANTDLKFRDVLSDLKIFALDPFHSAERNNLVLAKQMFLRFRSLVYQKSLVLAPNGEPDSANAETRKSATVTTIPDTVQNANTKYKSIKKPARPIGRPDDPTKGGRKRPLSDRQEEMATKKSKKISNIKSLASEKKAGRTVVDPDRKEKEASILRQPKGSKFVPPPRRVQPPPRVPEPTMLVLKFPQGTAMPTVAALKARFARFGPMDLESLRVFWQSSTCRVVFRFKADAQKAYEFAVSNTLVFGNENIRCQLREVGVPEPETKEETKEEAYPELPRYDPPLPPSSQLKSILKKSSVDETGQAPAPSKASPRVKFVLDGEESSRGEQAPKMASRNFVNGNNITIFGDSCTPSTTSTSVAMDFNSRNMQKVIQSSTLPPTTSMPVQHQFTLSAPQKVHHSEAPTIMYHNSNYSGGVMPTGSSTPTGTVDISQQMISMLTRCNEVVTNIKAHLGYVPYRSL